MKHVDYCVVCGSKEVTRFKGTMFPFVVDRMQGVTNASTECESIHCPTCDYHGTSARFTPEEEARYYKEYMDGEYLTARAMYEGDNIRSNADYQHNESTINQRKIEIYSFIEEHVSANDVHSLLDYGGNHGQGIPNQFSHARRYVLETESRTSADDIRFVGPNDSVEPMDLIICSHVMEHVSDIEYHMLKIKEMLKPGGYLYLEVPNERNAQNMSGRMFHEHINIFSLENLEYLFGLYKLTVVKKAAHANCYSHVFSILGRLE